MQVMDATRISDNTVVAIKKVEYHRKEARITKIFSTEDALQDPANHCVPVLDVIVDDAENIGYIVMPLLRRYDNPPFATIGEVMDFVGQTLEVSAVATQLGC